MRAEEMHFVLARLVVTNYFHGVIGVLPLDGRCLTVLLGGKKMRTVAWYCVLQRKLTQRY